MDNTAISLTIGFYLHVGINSVFKLSYEGMIYLSCWEEFVSRRMYTTAEHLWRFFLTFCCVCRWCDFETAVVTGDVCLQSVCRDHEELCRLSTWSSLCCPFRARVDMEWFRRTSGCQVCSLKLMSSSLQFFWRLHLRKRPVWILAARSGWDVAHIFVIEKHPQKSVYFF